MLNVCCAVCCILYIYIADVDGDDWPQPAAIRGLSSLFTVWRKRDKKDVNPEIYVIEEYPVSIRETFSIT